MQFLELVKERQSVRAYKTDTVEAEKIRRCIEAVRLAPSACNSQPWKFIIVDDKQLKNKIAQATSNRLLPLNHFTKQAPVHIVIVNEGSNLSASIGNKLKNKQYSLFDIGIAAEHFCLQAVEEGLGTCILGWFNEKKVKELLKIPNNKRPELIITLGYPNEDLREKKRKKTEKIISYNVYK